jgi:CheY-like chemotaxis protein
MIKNKLACFYFPTNALFVDDDPDFLKSLRLCLDEELTYQYEHNPVKALEKLKEPSSSVQFIGQYISLLKEADIEIGAEIENQDYTNTYFNIDISGFHKKMYDPNRFKELSLVVVDYSMPPMDGIEFCKRLSSHPIQKVMMTGYADDNLAINAFNEGIIQKFIRKHDQNFERVLNDIVYEMEYAYFQKLSAVIMQNLVLRPQSCLNDPIFIDFFEKLRKEKGLIEYYLVDEAGCFLFLDMLGNIYWLIVQTEEDMNHYHHVAEDYDAPKKIINPLKKREKILFLFSKADKYDVSVEDWGPYLHHANVLTGEKGTYYYSFIEGKSVYDIDVDKITSYDTYRYSK